MLFLWFLLQQIPNPVPENKETQQVDFEERVPVISFNVKVSLAEKTIRDLKKKDFSLQENQLQVNISNVEPVFLPRTIEILVDLSSSNGSQLDQSIQICVDLIENMVQGDRTKISSFSKLYLELTPFTPDKELLLKSMERLQERSSTALYDTISKALDSLSHQEGAKALIIISDGRDLLSTIPESHLNAQVKSYGIPILLVYSGKKPSPKADLLLNQFKYLRQLVEISNGFWFEAKDGFGKQLQQTVRDLGFRYKISYQPPQPENTDMWRSRSLSVLNDSDYVLSYSRGYRLSN